MLLPHFVAGSIMMVSDNHFNHYKFAHVNLAPLLDGILHEDQSGVKKMKNVEFVACSE